MISIIVAVSENNVIGTEGKLPWRLPADLKRFKKLTIGHPIIMGRKTHESIGRALPGRRNIVITRNPDFKTEGIEIARSLEKAVRLASLAHGKPLNVENKNEVFVIGGGEIYKMALPHTDKIYLTRVHTRVTGDVFFPELNLTEWKKTKREEYPADINNQYAHTFLVYERKK